MITGLFSLAILVGIGFLIWTAVRTASDANGDAPLDAAEVAKSAAIAVGLLLSMLAVSTGVIDLFQAAGGGERLTGSNTDVARGLSLLIVGTPIFGLLLRLTSSRRRERARLGDGQPLRGWSIYLVTALTISLVASLVSVAQILDQVYDVNDQVDSDVVAQLLGWLLIWAVHQFLLRPRFRVRGDIHLAIGTVVGLVWLVTGVSGLSAHVLSDAYDALFNIDLTNSGSLVVWIWTAAIGAAVWAWHWVPLRRGASTEPFGSRSPTWFVTVIAFAILPSFITLIFVVGGGLAGVGIWFLGTPRSDAANFFDAAPGLLTAGLVALAVWAYHRWVLDEARTAKRNDAMRFHDYAIAAVGLIGVVTGTSLIFNLLIEALTATTAIAERFEADNALIAAVVGTGLSAAVWWWMWSQVEEHRRHSPADESNSVWRKIYLTVTAGVGALVLAVSLIWILFTGLQDLFDGELGQITLRELTGPIGWSIAVLGAVWFHVGVWRSDRNVLSARPAPPPPPPSEEQQPIPAIEPQLQMRWATAADNGELFTLQRAAFVDEAVAYDTPQTPAVMESFDEFVRRVAISPTLVAVDGTRIVGSVSVREYRDGIPDIERLMVVPDRRRAGIAVALLDAIETWLGTEGHAEVQLIVGEIMDGPRALYIGRGYTLIERVQEPGGPALLTLRKPLAEPTTASS